jgi:hypothetical protein
LSSSSKSIIQHNERYDFYLPNWMRRPL